MAVVLAIMLTETKSPIMQEKVILIIKDTHKQKSPITANLMCMYEILL